MPVFISKWCPWAREPAFIKNKYPLQTQQIEIVARRCRRGPLSVSFPVLPTQQIHSPTATTSAFLIPVIRYLRPYGHLHADGDRISVTSSRSHENLNSRLQFDSSFSKTHGFLFTCGVRHPGMLHSPSRFRKRAIELQAAVTSQCPASTCDPRSVYSSRAHVWHSRGLRRTGARHREASGFSSFMGRLLVCSTTSVKS